MNKAYCLSYHVVTVSFMDNICSFMFAIFRIYMVLGICTFLKKKSGDIVRFQFIETVFISRYLTCT